jgi:two-component system phosphate regulon sensor histidine kinase PhoR
MTNTHSFEAIVTAMFDCVPDPMVRLGPNGILLEQNEEAEAMFGTWAQGRSYVTLFRQPTLAQAIEQVLQSGVSSEAEFIQTSTAGAERFIVRITALPEAKLGIVLHFEDVTHLTEVEEMRRDFVANVSHELRSPLTAILGFIETLRGPAAKDPAAQSRFLQIMQDEAQRMNRLIGDLLSLSRVESQQRQRPDQVIDVMHVVSRVQAALRPLVEESGCQVMIQRPDDVSTELRGDSDQLTQVFRNLIENALKYGGQNKTVTIKMRHETGQGSLTGRLLCVDVIDQGEGIDPLHIPRLTERFYRVDNHRSRAMGGTGLGLAIVKHIVQRHRGRLKITSEQGKGSCFSVILPSE